MCDEELLVFVGFTSTAVQFWTEGVCGGMER